MADSRNVPQPAQFHNVDYSNAAILGVAAAAGVAALPGALVGAVLTSLVWRLTRPDIVTRWLLAAVSAATVWALRSSVAIAWPWRAALGAWRPSFSAGLTPHTVAQSLPVEALAGPAVLMVFQFAAALSLRTIHGQEWARYRAMADRKKALERHWPGPGGSIAAAGTESAGILSLGTDAQSGQPFDLDLAELALHVFIPGGSGSGKTTTIIQLAEGVVANGYAVAFVDFKGSGLGAEASDLAARHGLPFTLVDPKDRKSVGYNPTSGEPAAVANKLIGAFTFGGEAEIYKQVAMEVIPVIARALAASKQEVSLANLYETLRPGGLKRLGRQLDGNEALQSRLEDLDESGGVGTAGYIGLQRRLGALMEGTFGDLFRKKPALDWRKVTAKPHVTYLSLSATAAGEDVELFGRVILQDLKQLCDERMRAIGQGKDVTPVLLIFDEFAAFREATQVVDLLLQARQAKAPLVVATQFLPEEVSIRRPVTSAGVLIVHRLEAEDAEQMAAQFGTHTVPKLTAQVDYEAGTSEKGSVRWVEEFNVHPNDLKELPVGVAAVYARTSKRRAIVRVAKRTD